MYLSNTANCAISPKNHRVESTGKEERLARAKEGKAARKAMRLRIAKAIEAGEQLSKDEQNLFLADEKRENKKVRRLLCEQ